jgi:hypothetical protein
VLVRLQSQIDEDKQPKSNITVRQAIEQWLDVAVLEDTTRERYEDLIRLYVMPTFGTLPAARLDAELLERFYARLHRCRTMCTGRARNGHICRPLSSITTRKIHYIIRGALGRAVRWQHLGVNKAAMAIAPSPERTEPDPPSADEAARLLNAAWADPEWTIHGSNAQPRSGLKEKTTKTGADPGPRCPGRFGRPRALPLSERVRTPWPRRRRRERRPGTRVDGPTGPPWTHRGAAGPPERGYSR